MASVRDITEGCILAGKYAVERCLGEGAMGIVFAARHLGLDEMVAIKFVRPDVHDVEGALARFAREAKLAARIHSEHVAKVFDVGVLERFGPFMVMEYLEGSSLAQLLEAEGPLPAERVAGYLLQACEALASAHSIGVVHRDVKPDNLFVTRRAGVEVVRLLDFGIAQLLSNGHAAEGEDTGPRAIVLGSPLYMAPEQLRASSPVDARADVWALGVVAYELLTGSMPFCGASLPEICATILETEPPALAAAHPPALADIVRRCLMKNPAQRFDGVADLAAALLPFAPPEARSYAFRSSSILRASAAVPAAVVAGPVQDGPVHEAAPAPARASAAPDPARQRIVRFHSSALVASATILALAALGVVGALSRADTPRRLVASAVVPAQAAPGAARPAPASLKLPAVEAPPNGEAASHALASAEAVAPGFSVVDAEMADTPFPLVARAPAETAPTSSASPSAETSVVAPVRTSRRARSHGTQARARRAATVDERARPTPRARGSRVRLVEPNARARLVQRDRSAAAGGTRR